MHELLKTNTAAWFNKICKNSQLTRKYVNIMNIKINDNKEKQKYKNYSSKIQTKSKLYMGCPTTYQTWHLFDNSKTNEDIATKQTHITDTFLFISHTTNVLLFKSHCNIFIGFRIIKEMPGLVGSGTPCSLCNHCKTHY
jgi:hypothetical protein